MYPLHDTIAAIATPPGEGAISVIRVSGSGAIELVGRMFRGRVKISEAATHTLHHGVILDDAGKELDDVVAAVFRAPASYTGEDVVEISCHGGVFVTREVLRHLVAGGARPALPGEFTRRAFLNGKMDLAQAEAVAEVIKSRSARSLRLSLDHLRGDLSERVNALRNEIVEIIAKFELELDFAEEGLEIVDRSEFRTSLNKISQNVSELTSSFTNGRIYAEGVRVGIIGKPNVGKSSLMNKLLESDRAIVTEIPGTTRDTITESLELSGIVFQLTDTAGIREISDAVEREGIRRSNEVISRSDLLVVMHDATDVLVSGYDETFAAENARRIDVVNKIDLVTGKDLETLAKTGALLISAKRGDGLGELKSLMVQLTLAGSDAGTGEHVTVTKLRHARALEEAQIYIIKAIDLIENGSGNELVAATLRKASLELSEITGGISSDDILNQIFSSFCIGK